MAKHQKSTNLGDDLHAAARSGDLIAIQSICSSNPLAVNSRDKHSRTPLHLAAWSGQAQVVNYLCKNKADVGAAAMDDMGAIHFASQKGHLEVVRALISSGASVKASNRKGMTALHYAVQGSHLELAKYLAKKGASLSVKTKAGKTPLDLASSEEIRSLLVECGKQSDTGVLKGEEKVTETHPKTQEKAEGFEGEEKVTETHPKMQEKAEGFEGEEKVTETHPKSQDKAEGFEGEVAIDKHEEEEESKKDESIKRKGDEEDIKESTPKPKKAKVNLNHLLASDDTGEEEETE